MEKISGLYASLIAAQAEFLPALKDTKNTFFKSSYAPLDSIWNACKGPLAKNKLMVSQVTDILENGTVILITRVYNDVGDFIESKLPVISSKPNDPQAFGSALTYCRRYSLAAILGLVTDDDDGEGAMDRDNQKNKVDPAVNVNHAVMEINNSQNRAQLEKAYQKYPQFKENPDFIVAVKTMSEKYPKPATT